MFVVETGEGLTDATAYVSVAEADQYFTSYGNDDTWGTLSNTRKQQLLNSATRTIDATFSYQGWRKNQNQILEFPRMFGSTSRYGYLANFRNRSINSDLIRFNGQVPRPLRQATAELAFRLSQEDRYTEFFTRDLGISSTRVGDVAITYSGNPVRSQNNKRAIPRYISQLIADFVEDNDCVW